MNEIPTFEQMYAEHGNRIARRVYRMVHDCQWVEDLVQEIWLKVWMRPPANTSNLVAWLNRVASSTVIDAIRRQQKEARHRMDHPLDELAYRLFDEHEVDDALLSEPTEWSWGKLKPVDQQALALALDGYSLSEMALIIGCTLASVKMRLMRARAAFIQLYVSCAGYE